MPYLTRPGAEHPRRSLSECYRYLYDKGRARTIERIEERKAHGAPLVDEASGSPLEVPPEWGPDTFPEAEGVSVVVRVLSSTETARVDEASRLTAAAVLRRADVRRKVAEAAPGWADVVGANADKGGAESPEALEFVARVSGRSDEVIRAHAEMRERTLEENRLIVRLALVEVGPFEDAAGEWSIKAEPGATLSDAQVDALERAGLVTELAAVAIALQHLTEEERGNFGAPSL